MQAATSGMTTERKRALIAVVRRIVFTGLVLLGAWLLLIWLRGHIPDGIINMMNQEMDGPRRPGEAFGLSFDSTSWDWTRSLWTNEPISELIGERLGLTLKVIGLTGLFGLVLALVLLLLGVAISRVTQRPNWLSKLRSILRLVLVSTGASIPIFLISTLFMVFLASRWFGGSQPVSAVATFWSVLVAALLPAWLLVQAGHGEIVNLPENVPIGSALPRLGISLVIRLLRLVGIIIVVGITIEQVMAQPGLGRVLMQGLNQRDFPVVFGITWVFVIVVALTKLAADLFEIAGNRLERQTATNELVEPQPKTKHGIPMGWLVFSLALIAISIIVAVVGPSFAPYGWNEIMLQNRLAPPGPGLLLGADNVGRDIFTRILYGLRIDIIAGIACAGIVAVLAAGWGLLAEYLRRLNTWAGDFLEDLVTLPAQIIGVFPWLVLFLLFLSMVGIGLGWTIIFGSLVLLPRAANMIREAGRSLPSGHGLFGSVLKAAPVMIIFAVAGGIFYTASASYLGMGVPPPYPELGGMLSGAGRQFMMQAPWMALWPSIMLASLLLVWVMAGDALLERLGFRSKAVWAKIME